MKNLPHLFLAAAVAAAAIADPAPKPTSIVIGPGDFARDKNVRIQKDTIDNFQYARLSNFDTNAPVEAISWKVTPAQAGKWHILMTIRSGAAVALDQNAALATVTTSVKCTECGAFQTPAKAHVTGSLGDESWQIVSLGVVELPEGAVVSLSPRKDAAAAPVPYYTDLRRITLLDPDFIGKTQEALPAVEPAAK